jgi:hypothetical protein
MNKSMQFQSGFDNSGVLTNSFNGDIDLIGARLNFGPYALILGISFLIICLSGQV